MKNKHIFLNGLLYLLCILFTFGQIGRVSFLGQQINVYFYEIILTALLLYLGITCKLQPIRSYLKEDNSILLFLGYLGVSFLLFLFRFTFLENAIGFLYFL